MPRIIVAIELVNGGRTQAVCRTGGCDWKGWPFIHHATAAEEARRHRQAHRAKLPDQGGER